MPGLSTQGWVKMIVSGAVLCIGGPALVMWVSPTEEELIKRFNPDLQKRALENRDKNREEFDAFVTKLKESSKGDKNLWETINELEEKQREEARTAKRAEHYSLLAAAEARKQEVRDSVR